MRCTQRLVLCVAVKSPLPLLCFRALCCRVQRVLTLLTQLAKRYDTRDSRVITQPSTSLAQRSLTCEF